MRHLALVGLLLAVVAVWGWTFVLVKDAVTEYGVVSFLAIRFVIGTVSVGALAVRRLDRRTLKTGGAIGAVLASAYLFQTFGLRHTTATNTGLITGLFIVFVPISGRLLFGVRTGRALWAATGASVLGLALGQLASATLIFAAACPLVETIEWPAPKVWFALFVTGVLATAVAFFVQTHVQKRLPAVQTAMITMTEPVFAVFFGYLLAGDRLTPLQLAGAGIMTGAVFLTQLRLALKRSTSNASSARAVEGGTA